MGINQRGQVTMSEQEIAEFIPTRRTAILSTVGPTGQPHVIAMWFAWLDGELWFETKAKSQKAVNLRRDPRVTVLVEDGLTYDTLRGVSIEGTAEIVEGADPLWRVGVNVWERYTGPYTDEVKPLVEMMLHNRVAIRLKADRVRSWDHRKLGLPPMEIGGTTAPTYAPKGNES
jgi:PPOX class probable F420-dependent enzyme